MIKKSLQMAYDSSTISQNGVTTQLMPSAMSQYQRTYSTPVSAAYPQLQTSAWMHPQAATQYIVQPHAMAQMIPSGLDPNTLHFSTLMPQLTAQMSQIQLSGVSGASVSPQLWAKNRLNLESTLSLNDSFEWTLLKSGHY